MSEPHPPQFSDGDAYERMMGRWSRAVGEIFIDWVAPKPGLTWLDVGCGNGAFTELLFSRCAPSRVVAIDPSEGLLTMEPFREALKKMGIPSSIPGAEITKAKKLRGAWERAELSDVNTTRSD